jgi:hypothetical protein
LKNLEQGKRPAGFDVAVGVIRVNLRDVRGIEIDGKPGINTNDSNERMDAKEKRKISGHVEHWDQGEIATPAENTAGSQRRIVG